MVFKLYLFNSYILIFSKWYLGRLVIVPFLEVERSPKGLEVQQMAEAVREEMLEVASGAIGEIIGLHWKMETAVQHSSTRNCSSDKENLPRDR